MRLEFVPPKWFDFIEGASLLIRPFSFLDALSPENAQVILEVLSGKATLDFAWEVFRFCLIDWRNVVDVLDQPLVCSTPVKRAIFDRGINNMPQFVFEKALALRIGLPPQRLVGKN